MKTTKRKVAIVGTNGLPANYGGFETLVEYLTKYLSGQFEFIVYCSKLQKKKIARYNNAKLVYIPLKANGWQSLLYDFITLFHAAHTSDVILYLGPVLGFIIPFIKVYFKKRIIINYGGFNEWERVKYSKPQRFFIKLVYKYTIKYADDGIADNRCLQESILKTFKVNSIVIRYGGDHVVKMPLMDNIIKKYPFLLEEYYINVSRAQVDNNLHIVLDAFRDIPDKKLVMVSNWNISNYGIELKKDYHDKYKNIILLDAIYDISEINILRAYAKAYIHSHSYCGTSPSLVEAMCLGLPVFSYDVPTNRETTEEKACFFKSSEDLKKSILDKKNNLEKNGKNMKAIANIQYAWSDISRQYAELFLK
jgi:glycosyltransferase involved in cell wall biosynthesis